jgi:hypothetical protein
VESNVHCWAIGFHFGRLRRAANGSAAPGISLVVSSCTVHGSASAHGTGHLPYESSKERFSDYLDIAHTTFIMEDPADGLRGAPGDFPGPGASRGIAARIHRVLRARSDRRVDNVGGTGRDIRRFYESTAGRGQVDCPRNVVARNRRPPAPHELKDSQHPSAEQFTPMPLRRSTWLSMFLTFASSSTKVLSIVPPTPAGGSWTTARIVALAPDDFPRDAEREHTPGTYS